MTVDERLFGSLLAEILRLQRWVGGDAVSPARIFGLMHGFESVLEEDQGTGISRATQEKVEDLLAEVDKGGEAADGVRIKQRLREVEVDEADAGLVMQLCRLQDRFTDAVEKIARAPGSPFGSLLNWRSAERSWNGALHYLELCDATEGARKKLHAAFSPCIPRVGDIVEPERGSRMKVVAVEHVVAHQTYTAGGPDVLLTPYIVLQPIEK